MQDSTIIQNISNWATARAGKDSTVFKQLFNNIKGFSFTAGSRNDLTDLYYHAYAGIENGILKFYIIRSDYDIAKYDESKIIQTTMIPLTGMLPILPVIANERIELWKKNHNKWIDVQLDSDDSIYQVFVIPADDIGTGEITAYFALNTDGGYGQEYAVADLIIYMEPVTGGPYSYFDLVRPVPPFKPRPGTPRSREVFNLLPQ